MFGKIEEKTNMLEKFYSTNNFDLNKFFLRNVKYVMFFKMC